MDLSVYGRRRPQPEAGEVESPAPRCDPNERAEGSLLTARAQTLVAALPLPVRPKELLKYPHVVNRIAEAWGMAVRMRVCLQDLLLDSRGTRHGFPLPVIAELTALRGYYETRVQPVRPDVWASVRRRS